MQYRDDDAGFFHRNHAFLVDDDSRNQVSWHVEQPPTAEQIIASFEFIDAPNTYGLWLNHQVYWTLTSNLDELIEVEKGYEEFLEMIHRIQDELLDFQKNIEIAHQKAVAVRQLKWKSDKEQ